MDNERIYLSPPDMSDVERTMMLEAFDSNWIAPVGPDLAAFEAELGRWTQRNHVAALSSGTAALHLALLLLGVGRDDEVLVPTFTFVATANAVLHAGATPVFVDSSDQDWNLCPDLVNETLERKAASGKLPKAVIAVDLYGQCADYARLEPICARYDVPLVADSAEALGASRDGRAAGSQGVLAALSFNGNKIITTGGGGALLANDEALVTRARHLATQAREPAPHYQHVEPGFNYRMSNLLAALGRGQLQRLPDMIKRRTEIAEAYKAKVEARPGMDYMPVPADSQPNRWLSVITVDADVAGTDRESIRLALEARNIESRPAWKPMHLQPLFADAEAVGGAVSERAFRDGLCLPSGSALKSSDLDQVLSLLD